MPLGTNAGAIWAGEFLLPFSSRTDRRPESMRWGRWPQRPDAARDPLHQAASP